jgi:hypothetical protein
MEMAHLASFQPGFAEEAARDIAFANTDEPGA